jgi:hypothetical protein
VDAQVECHGVGLVIPGVVRLKLGEVLEEHLFSVGVLELVRENEMS